MPKQIRWTKKCSGCGKYMPEEYNICDICLLVKFELYHKQTHDSLDHMGIFALYREEDVLKALRSLL